MLTWGIMVAAGSYAVAVLLPQKTRRPPCSLVKWSAPAAKNVMPVLQNSKAIKEFAKTMIKYRQ